MSATSNDTVQSLQNLAAIIDKLMGGAGFALIVFNIGEPTKVNYVANVARTEMVGALKEVLARWEGRAHDAPEVKQ